MSIQVIDGTGKLYEAGGNEAVAIVNYRIWEKPEEWGGEFTVSHVIWPSGDYVIELENGRRGTCLIDIEQSVREGCPITYRYGLRGNGTLTQ